MFTFYHSLNVYFYFLMIFFFSRCCSNVDKSFAKPRTKKFLSYVTRCNPSLSRLSLAYICYYLTPPPFFFCQLKFNFNSPAVNGHSLFASPMRGPTSLGKKPLFKYLQLHPSLVHAPSDFGTPLPFGTPSVNYEMSPFTSYGTMLSPLVLSFTPHPLTCVLIFIRGSSFLPACGVFFPSGPCTVIKQRASSWITLCRVSNHQVPPSIEHSTHLCFHTKTGHSSHNPTPSYRLPLHHQ